MTKHKLNLGKNILTAVGVVLVWRGIWYVLDWIDISLFGGDHTWTAVVGVLVGLLILYIPDGDLEELGKL